MGRRIQYSQQKGQWSCRSNLCTWGESSSMWCYEEQKNVGNDEAAEGDRDQSLPGLLDSKHIILRIICTHRILVSMSIGVLASGVQVARSCTVILSMSYVASQWH